MTAKGLEQMLGLVEPWRVTSLEMDHAARKARLRGECAATTWADPRRQRFRNFAHDRVRILFLSGKPDLSLP
ncbi:MAG: hypothetical protein KA004_06380 [Verrucomicrobiales bacterium]|nr:hypothetical protein [Verrucomicrobiales bacterium]